MTELLNDKLALVTYHCHHVVTCTLDLLTELLNDKLLRWSLTTDTAITSSPATPKFSSSSQFFLGLEDYLTEEFQLGDTAAAFIHKNYILFDNVNKEDIPISCFQAFEEYQALFEGKLETYCARQNVSKQLFVEWCTIAVTGASENEGGHREFLEILLAADSFEVFLELMTNAVKSMELEQLQQQQKNQDHDTGRYQKK